MTILAFSCILHSLCEREDFKQAQNTASVFLLLKKKITNTFNNIEIKQLRLHHTTHHELWQHKMTTSKRQKLLQTPL